jgi:hypothetical protein
MRIFYAVRGYGEFFYFRRLKMMKEIEYPTQCETCEAHKTDLGILKALEKTVLENFPSWTIDSQADLVISWFEKTWKEEMAIQIQRDKKSNMKEWNK